MFYFLEYIACVREYYECEKISLEIFTDLHFVRPLLFKLHRTGFWDACLLLELLHEFSLCSVFQNLPAMVQYLVHVNIVAPTTGALWLGPQTQNGDVSKMVIMILIKFQ
jgi:hypothetical protein